MADVPKAQTINHLFSWKLKMMPKFVTVLNDTMRIYINIFSAVTMELEREEIYCT